MIISIIQPSFIPWLGYFEQIAYSDIFVYLDDVQYTRRDWRNRNRLKSPDGLMTVTVPVQKSPRDTTLIKDVAIAQQVPWASELINKITAWYARAQYFKVLIDSFSEILTSPHQLLVDLNYELNSWLLDYLQISRPIYLASDVPTGTDNKNERIIEICLHFQAEILYDGASAQNFIDLDLFNKNGVQVIFQDYQHPVYHQLFGDFVSQLSVLDLIMNTGPRARDYILSSPNPFGTGELGHEC